MRDSGKVFDLKGDLSEKITNKNFNVYLSKLSDKRIMYDFAEELNFDLKAIGKKSTRDRTLIKLLKSPSLMVSASGVSKTKFLSSGPGELCERLKILQQKKQAGNSFDIFNQENVAIVDKFLEKNVYLRNNISKF